MKIQVTAILSLLILFSGCAELEMREALEGNDPKECDKLNADDGDECYKIYAVRLKDAGLCMKMTEGYNRENCYVLVANATSDTSLCEKVTLSSTTKQDCYNRIAVSTKNVAVCYELEDYPKQLCIRNLAARLKDEGICDEAEYGGSRDECYKMVAAQKKDAGICEKITTEKGRMYCKAAIPSA